MSRQKRALAAALAMHGLAAALLSLVRAPPPADARRSSALELELSPAPRAVRATAATTSELAAPPRRRGTGPGHATAAAKRVPETTPPLPVTETAAAPGRPANPAGPASPAGPAELFPRALLEELAAAHPGRRPGSAPPNDKDRDTPGGWLDDAAAEARTRAGQVAPIWRDVERELVQSFNPPVAVVHDVPSRQVDRFTDKLKSLFKQSVAVVARGEEGLRHPTEPGSHAISFGASGSIDPSNQGFPGVPEGLNLRSMPLGQQQAAMAAIGDPAGWIAAEIEISVDGAGNVTRARVAVPSGRRAFDRYALGLVEERVARAAPPASLSRWVCSAGYAVSRPDAVGINFDLSMLFDPKLARQLSLQYPLKDRVESRVALKWVKTTH